MPREATLSVVLLVAACLGGLAVVVVAKLDSAGAGLDMERFTPAERAQRAVDPSEPRLAARHADVAPAIPRAHASWWLYDVARRDGGLPQAEHYQLRGAAAGSLEQLQQELRKVHGVSTDTFVALETSRYRACLPIADAEALRVDSLLAAIEADRGVVCQIRFEDRTTGAPLAGLLLDADSKPLGPLGPEATVVVLDPSFRGMALAPGYMPGRIVPPNGGADICVRLRAAAFVVGTVAGLPDHQPGTLFLMDLDDGPEAPSPRDAALVMSDGSFRVGPVAVGRRQLAYDAQDAWLARESRQLVSPWIPARRAAVARAAVDSLPAGSDPRVLGVEGTLRLDVVRRRRASTRLACHTAVRGRRRVGPHRAGAAGATAGRGLESRRMARRGRQGACE
jgi:hypothetical protein